MPGGRPPTESAKINPQELDKLLGLCPSEQEVMDWFDVKLSTLSRFIKKQYGCSFEQVREKRFVRTRIALKRAQIESALKGNTTMQIWLGKQYLGQSDKTEIKEDITSRNVDTVYHSEWGGTGESAQPGRSDT